MNRLRPFENSDLILWLLHQICRWKFSALLANFSIQILDRFQTQQNAQETHENFEKIFTAAGNSAALSYSPVFPNHFRLAAPYRRQK